MNTLKTTIHKGIFPLLFAFFAFYAFPALAQSKTTSVKGQVIDLSCYMPKGAMGPSHQMCTQMCLKRGLPAGLLTKDGKVFVLLENHKKAKAYAQLPKFSEQKVVISGHVASKNGLNALTVEAIKPVKN